MSGGKNLVKRQIDRRRHAPWVGARSVFGDLVVITRTEALAISVEKAEKK